jgi:D-alanyl-D-alanine carboxypeptidase (penicillin-binding protein 5/6)
LTYAGEFGIVAQLFSTGALMNKILRMSLAVLLVGTLGSSWAATKTKTAAKAAPAPAAPAKAKSSSLARDPYLGAIVVDAADGRVLFEDNADAKGHPASTLKLINLLIILEKIEGGALKLTDKVTATADAAKVGGTQVWLRQGEIFSVDELLYAMMVQSANDAATALAIHIAGSKEAFVELMNQRAKALGMESTIFHSVHGLPPSAGQEHDVATPRDFARLCLELLKHKDALRYTSTVERQFRVTPETIIRSHNHLLENYRGKQPRNFKGCDGLKTGYITAGGYCIATTAKTGANRVVVVIFGSTSSDTRDLKARELMSKGLGDIAAWRAKHPLAPPPSVASAPAAPAQPAAPQPMPAAPPVSERTTTSVSGSTIAIIVLSSVVVVLLSILFITRRPRDPLG